MIAWYEIVLEIFEILIFLPGKKIIESLPFFSFTFFIFWQKDTVSKTIDLKFKK